MTNHDIYQIVHHFYNDLYQMSDHDIYQIIHHIIMIYIKY